MPSQRALFRIALNTAIDGALAAAALPIARVLAAPQADPFAQPWTLAAAAALLLIAGIPFRLSMQYWRFAGVNDLLGVAAAAIAAAALLPLILHETATPLPSPTFPLIHGLVLAALLAAPRAAYRLMQQDAAGAIDRQSILLIGAGEGADLFLRALAADRNAPFAVAGILSTGTAQTGRRINGQPILGSIADAPAILARARTTDSLPATIVLTDPDLTGPALSALMEAADREGVRVARAPRITSLGPTAEPIALKPVAIEDLLNRAQVPLDREGMARLIHGRRVLVTGAGGTIGAELARQVAALGPAHLSLLDSGEFALWQIDTELGEAAPQVPRTPIIADIRDEPRIRAVFEATRPELVFHAAALKHVPMVEANPAEGILTNAQGTRIVADAARSVGALAMVLISTDKAVNPSSVMGATKRLAEMYCQGLDREARSSTVGGADKSKASTRHITVRFGNVLGSTGSVVPLFQRQLARGGPLTVTHPDMVRYFMTVREAVGLVLAASVVGADATSPDFLREGGIFVLDMGEPVKIVDLARQMIRLAGLRPDADIQIRFTGLRPGEKLFEELFHGREPAHPTGIPGLLTATPRTADPALIGRAIDDLAAAARAGNTKLALAQLGRLIPEFAHNADGSRAAGA